MHTQGFSISTGSETLGTLVPIVFTLNNENVKQSLIADYRGWEFKVKRSNPN